MPNLLRHFSIECDDVERARAFYEAVFGWEIAPWGPPGFYQIAFDPANRVTGDLREREGAHGEGMRGFVCTFGVGDLDATTAAVLPKRGSVLAQVFPIARLWQ